MPDGADMAEQREREQREAAKMSPVTQHAFDSAMLCA